MRVINTLYRCSINVLYNWVVSLIQDRNLFSDGEKVVALIRYLQNLPISLKDELMDKLVNGVYYDRMIRVRSLRILLCDRSRTLKITLPCEPKLSKHFMKVIRQQGKNLLHLELKGFYIKPRDCKAFQIILRRFTKLQKFSVKFKSCCGVYHTLTQNLPHLNICVDNLLNESYHFMTTHNILMGILTELVISEQFPATDLAEIVPQLPFLTSLGNYPQTGLMIKTLDSRHIHLNLTQVYDRETSVETLESMLRVCPRIRSLTLKYPSFEVFDLLPSFQHLLRLRIENIVAVENCFLNKLRILELKQVSIQLNLAILLESCPGLDSFTGVNLALKKNSKPTFTHRLLKLFLKNVKCDENSMKSIIFSLPYLQYLNLYNVLILKKSDVSKFIERRPLRKLNYVVICSKKASNVTRFDLVDILINNPEWMHLNKESLGYETFIIDLHNNDKN